MSNPHNQNTYQSDITVLNTLMSDMTTRRSTYARLPQEHEALRESMELTQMIEKNTLSPRQLSGALRAASITHCRTYPALTACMEELAKTYDQLHKEGQPT